MNLKKKKTDLTLEKGGLAPAKASEVKSFSSMLWVMGRGGTVGGR